MKRKGDKTTSTPFNASVIDSMIGRGFVEETGYGNRNMKYVCIGFTGQAPAPL